MTDCGVAAKLVILSNNCPSVRRSEVEYYAMLSKTDVLHYTGSTHLHSSAWYSFFTLAAFGFYRLLLNQQAACSLVGITLPDYMSVQPQC